MPAFYKDLTPYQIAWLENKNPFIVCVKSRRIGISYVEAYKSVLNAIRPDNPRNTYYTSFNFESAKSWLKSDCCYWIGKLNLVSEIVEGVELFDPKQRDPIQVSRIMFKNGYSIQVLPSKQEVFRGIQGRMIVVMKRTALSIWMR